MEECDQNPSDADVAKPCSTCGKVVEGGGFDEELGFCAVCMLGGVLETFDGDYGEFGQVDSDIEIEGFMVEQLLGCGGMGAVYRAYEEKLDRHVALKVVLGCTLA